MSRRPGFQRTAPFKRFARHLLASAEGATAMEYALIAGLVGVVLVGAVGTLGDAIRDLPMAALIAAFASALS